MFRLSFGQDSFSKGYLINKANDTTFVKIAPVSTKNTPKFFEFTYLGEDKINNTKDFELKEVGYEGGERYIFQVVEIDRFFTKDIGKLGSSRSITTKAEELFLELIADGKIRLAKYVSGDLERFYYENERGRFVLLIQNYYVVNDKLMENDTYRYQLKNMLKEADFGSALYNKVSYTETSLLNLLKDYYVATNQEIPFLNLNQNKTQLSELFSFTIRPGLRINSMDVDDGRDGSENVDFGSKIGFRLGIQFELNLYNIKGWSLLFEPTLQQFKASEVVQNTTSFIDYYSVELALGTRYYFYENNTSKLFVNAHFLYDVPVKTDFNVDVLSRTPATNLQESLGFNIGIGYRFNNTMSVEVQYNATRDIVNEYFSFTSRYQGYSLIFGYTLF